ncbi:MAG: hypothetical protein LAT54_07020 [Cryomorphaceae bacterium]|nr:hypothetical protein [Cryomorphaceae bacterium]
MRYKGKTCEVVGEKEVFGQRIAWIRLMKDGSFHEVPYDDLENPNTDFSIPYLRFVSIAAKIKDEVDISGAILKTVQENWGTYNVLPPQLFG